MVSDDYCYSYNYGNIALHTFGFSCSEDVSPISYIIYKFVRQQTVSVVAVRATVVVFGINLST